MSFSLIDCWDCGPTTADYVGLAIMATLVALPLFLWWSERSRRELEDKKELGLFRSE